MAMSAMQCRTARSNERSVKTLTLSYLRILLPGIFSLLLGSGNVLAEGGIYRSPCNVVLDSPNQGANLDARKFGHAGSQKKQVRFKLSFNDCPQVWLSNLSGPQYGSATYEEQGISGAILRFPDSNIAADKSRLLNPRGNGLRTAVMLEDERGHTLPVTAPDGSHVLPPGNTILWFSTQFEPLQKTSQTKPFGDVIDVQIAYL